MVSMLKNLKKEVEKRKKIIAEIVKFVEAFVIKEGTVTKYEQGSCNTHIVREFKDFAGFTMFFSDGETMFGGTSVKLTFNSFVVFDIHYQSSLEEDCRVYIFNEVREWLPAFRSAVKKKKCILKQSNMKKIREEAAYKSKVTKEKKKKALLEEAARLRLAP